MTTTHETPNDHLRELFERRGGYLTGAEVRAAGIYPKLIDRWVRRGLVERVQRGVYRLANAPFASHADLIELQLRVPYARPCLVTALDLHGLTTTKPVRVQLAIPGNRAFPDVPYPPTEVFYYGPDSYRHGTLVLSEDGRDLTTYTPEKTLADLLKYAPKLGRDVYLEGLKNYLASRRHPDVPALIEAARINRVERELRRDLEVLTHDAGR